MTTEAEEINRRVAATVLLVVGLACGAAPAEAAWVLWSSASGGDIPSSGGLDNIYGPTWSIESATESLDACKVEMLRAIEKGFSPYRDMAAKQGGKELSVSKSERGYIILIPNKSVRMTEFKCLPDTIDPRRSK